MTQNEIMIINSVTDIEDGAVTPELLPKEETFVVAGRTWSSMGIKRMVCVEGKTIRDILIDSLRANFTSDPTKEPTDFQKEVWLDRCRCKVDGIEIPSELWKEFKPQAGAFVEFLVAPGKGGGGKNVLSTVLMAVVVVAAVVTHQWYLTSFGATTSGFAMGSAAAAEAASVGIATNWTAGSLAASAVAGMAVMTLGTYAVGKICPMVVSPQQQVSSSSANNSQTYSISGSRNAANPFGYIPLVLGKYRFAGPLGAKSWTKQIGDDQYFNMLVVWGHPDMSVTDFRIGDTPLSNFQGVDHVFHGATTGNDLKYFGKSYNEQSVGATLKYGQYVERVVGECDSISVDIYAPAMADTSSGGVKGSSAIFTIEYAPVGTENWQAYSASTRFYAPPQYCDCYTGAGQNDAWATSDGTWHVRLSGADWENPNWTNGKINAADPHWNPYPIERYKDKHKHHEWWFRGSWYDAGLSTNITISGAQVTPLTRSYEWAVPHGEYKVRIRRTSLDSTDVSIQNEIQWSISRAITNVPAFNTPIPICVSELCIKASDQLSGYIDNFNALCHSIFPVYNPETKGWDRDEEGEYVKDETQNPADILRYLFTSEHALLAPYSEAKIDDSALAEFAQWCLDNDYHFDFVCDSEASAWTRWTSVASAGRGAVTTDNDGLFGVTCDNDRKTVVQMFTPRNSWSFNIEREFYKLPHALRVTWYDEDDDYQEKEGFVYADGYDKSNAVDIVEWNVTGKTRWADVYKMGRYYLASTKLRPITVTLSTDWEWLMCRRGDVVGVSHDVLMNTFGTARVVSLIYSSVNGERVYVSNEDDIPTDGTLPIGVRLDDTVVFSEDQDFGIAIRNTNGNVLTYQVSAPYGEETEDMIFVNPITVQQIPYIGALASVSIFGQETSKYLVASISVTNDNSAELTLVPWAMPEIINSESGLIPDWEPPIYLPTIGGTRSLPAPSIRDIRSDESMLKWSGNSLIVCMGVWWQLPSGISADLGRISVQGKLVKIDLETGEADASIAPVFQSVDSTSTTNLVFENVEEGATYRVFLRLISETGVVSEWSNPVDHKVIGKTSVPPYVANLQATIESPSGIRLTWDAVDVMDLSVYRILAPVKLETTATTIIAQVPRLTGILEFSMVAVDTGGRVSNTPATASVEVFPPKAPEKFSLDTRTDGLYLVWDDCDTTWPIQHYIITDEYLNATSKELRTQYVISPRAVGYYQIDVQPVDIFANNGERVSFTVEIEQPSAPVISTEINNGVVRLTWKAVSSSFPIRTYQVYSVNGQLLQETSATFFDITAPAGTLEYRVRAIDTAGNMSAFGEVVLELTAPEPPVLTAKLNENRDGIDLEWTVPDSMLPVLTYDIVRQWGDSQEQDYGSTDSTTLSVEPLPVGTHMFMVRAVDASGNKSLWGTYEFTVKAPGAAFLTDVNVIDNNVQVYWNEPTDQFFAIAYYNFSTVEDGYAALIGRIDARFASRFERQAGEYTYQICPVDVAGNIGVCSQITAQVAQPQDFIFFDDYDSTFNGAITNGNLDGKGGMILPTYPDETWEENVARISGLTGIAEDELTWQDKIDHGYLAWQSPTAPEGTYVEIVDVGTDVPSTNITVTVSKTVLEGNPQLGCCIEVSSDMSDWREVAENGFSTYASSFRYVRYTFTVTGGMLYITSINYRLDVKKQSDFGSVYSGKDDNGEGFISVDETPDLYGTWIPFVVAFTDIQSGPIAFCNEKGKSAYVTFKDELHPTGFRVYVLDSNGNRVDGQVSWSAFGV